MNSTSYEFIKIRISILSFDWAQDGEPFDAAHGREPAERLVEPFRVSDFVLRNSGLSVLEFFAYDSETRTR